MMSALCRQTRSSLVAAVLTLSLPTTVFAEKPKLAVMPLGAKNMPKDTVEIIDALLTGEIAAANRYQVLGVSDINIPASTHSSRCHPTRFAS